MYTGPFYNQEVRTAVSGIAVAQPWQIASAAAMSIERQHPSKAWLGEHLSFPVRLFLEPQHHKGYTEEGQPCWYDIKSPLAAVAVSTPFRMTVTPLKEGWRPFASLALARDEADNVCAVAKSRVTFEPSEDWHQEDFENPDFPDAEALLTAFNGSARVLDLGFRRQQSTKRPFAAHLDTLRVGRTRAMTFPAWGDYLPVPFSLDEFTRITDSSNPARELGLLTVPVPASQK